MKLSDRFLENRDLEDVDEFYQNLCSLYYMEDPKSYFPKKLNWCPGDMEDNYDKLPQEHRDHWDPLLAERPIEYNLNKYGMRMEGEPFECTDSILFLGCSFTFGTGRYKEEIWPEIVMSETGIQGFNIAAPSVSLDSCFRFLNQWLPVTKSKTVMLLIPPGTRYEICDGRYSSEQHPSFTTLGAWSLTNLIQNGEKKHLVAKFISDSFLQGLYQKVNIEKNLAAMSYVCSEYGARLIVYDHNEMDPHNYKHLTDKVIIQKKIINAELGISEITEKEISDFNWDWKYSARDGAHPDRGYHKLAAKVFIEEMKNGKGNRIP